MKNYFKKSLSVFMAALMLLSCWVFVAPQKAEAVDSETYYYKIWAYTSDGGDGSKYDWRIYGKANNGKGNETQIATSDCYLKSNKTTYTIKEGSSTSFPERITLEYANSAVINRTMKSTMHVEIGSSSSNMQEVSITCTCSQNGSASGSEISFDQRRKTTKFEIKVNSGSYPYAKTAVISSQPSATTLPPTGTGETTFDSYLKDQFGVRVSSSASTYARAYSLSGNSSSSSTCTYTSTASGADTSTIALVNAEKVAGSTNTKKVKATITYTFNGKTASATTNEFAVTDPSYKFTYNGNDGTVNKAEYSTYYGNSAGNNIPTSGTRDGYEYIGMYTSAKSDNFSFDKPVAGTTSGYTGQLTKETEVNSDITWYAAWWAKTYTIKFYDVDGNLLLTRQAKYDKPVTDYVTEAEIATFPEQIYHKNPSDTGSTFNYVFAGWVVDEATDANGKDYADVIGKAPKDVVLKGNITFRPAFNVEKNSYTVKFIGADGNELSSKSDFVYRDDAATIKPADPSASSGTSDYTYRFKGWTTTAPTSGNIIVVNASSRDVENNNYVATTNNFTVRCDQNYYPVFEKCYSVKFYDKDGNALSSAVYAQGAADVTKPADQVKAADNTYTYTFKGWTTAVPGANGHIVDTEGVDINTNEAITLNSSFTANANAEYYPVFEAKYIEYTVKVTDQYGINTKTQTLHYGDKISVVEEAKPGDGFTYTFLGWDDGASKERYCVGNAEYYAVYEASPAIYVIKFVDYNGDIVDIFNIAHGKKLTSIPEPTLTYVDTQEPETKQDDIRYNFDIWADSEGNAPSIANSVTADATYTATYTSETTYPVYYVSEDETLYTDYAFAGDMIPAYVGEAPSKADDVYAKNYEFKSWADKDGNAVDVMPQDGITLYAQFEGEKILYTVTFIRDDGTVLSSGEYGYGEQVENIPNTDKAQDPDYRYDFKAWEPALPTQQDNEGNDVYLCRGDATHVAIYKKTRVLYTVEFYNDDGSLIKEQSYINGARIVPPIPTSATDPGVGFSWNFKGWVRADGTEFNADKINGEELGDEPLQYMAVYEKVGADCKITFVVDGEEIEKTVKYDSVLEDAFFTATKDYDAAYHYIFAKWTDEDGNDIDASMKVESDIKLVAVFNKAEHTCETEIENAPTFTVKGDAFEYCTQCEYKTESTEIDVLKDEKAPTAKLTIEKTSWEGKTTVDTANETPISRDSRFIVNAEDKGNVDAIFNKDGKGHGVASIEMSVQEPSADLDVEAIPAEQWEVLSYNLNQSTYANFTKKLGETGVLYQVEDGTRFVVVIKITDRSGNVSIMNSGALVCDETSPKIEVKNDVFTNDLTLACTYAKVTVEDPTLSSVVIKLDGEEIAAAADGIYTAPGKYQIVATDIVGNESRETFTLAAHDMVNYHKNATCVEDGYDYNECYVCSIKTETQVLKATGVHTFKGNGTHHEAICDENGYTVQICTVCHQPVITPDDPATTGHDGIEISRKEATCIAEGSATIECLICHKTATQILPVNPDAHKFTVLVKRVEPTMYKEGSETYKCELCGKLDAPKPIAKLPSLGFKVTVTDEEGNLMPNANISVYENGKLVVSGSTSANGADSLRIPCNAGEKQKDCIIVVETYEYNKVTKKVSIYNGAEFIIQVKADSQEHSCSCTCHNDGFIGTLYRFFHEISYLFTKTYKCCNDPDARYKHVA